MTRCRILKTEDFTLKPGSPTAEEFGALTLALRRVGVEFTFNIEADGYFADHDTGIDGLEAEDVVPEEAFDAVIERMALHVPDGALIYVELADGSKGRWRFRNGKALWEPCWELYGTIAMAEDVYDALLASGLPANDLMPEVRDNRAEAAEGSSQKEGLHL